MFEKKYEAEDVESAHNKQKHIARGQGGVIFSQIEKEIIDNHIKIPEKKKND